MDTERHETQEDATRPYRDRVMYLNAFRRMDERARRNDIAYAIVLSMLLFVIPIIVGSVATILGHKVLAFVLALASIASGFALGLCVRHRIINKHFQVKDVKPWVELVEVDGHLLSELLSTPALAFPDMCDLPGITFVYNWLPKHKAIPRKTRVKLYRLTGSRLVSYLEGNVDGNMDILVIPTDELSIPSDKEDVFWYEFALLGGRMLEDVANMVRSAANEDTEGEPFANKGQKLS